jgi:protein gp37
MSENTPIEWADASWSPWEGCQKVGPGCDHCYAESMNRWLRRGENWGPGAPRRTYSDDHWEKPLRWNRMAAGTGHRPKVFPSVCDPFDNAAPEGLRARFAQMILDTPNLIWLLLTKRIGNAAAMLEEMFPAGIPENVWIGATIVDRSEMLRDAAKLKAIKTASRSVVTFWSVEPMLGDLGEIPLELMPDGVIVGGESGRGARPLHPAWVRRLRDQCLAAGVKFMFKQWGAWAPYRAGSKVILMHAVRGRLPAGSYEQDGHIVPMQHLGKDAGREFDGVIYDALPDVSRPAYAAAVATV